MAIILWIIFGALAGWMASVLMKTNSGQGTMMDVVLGIVGAVVGGFLMGVIGAVVVIYLGRKMQNR